MSELAKGRSDIDVQGIGRRDEIGEMAQAVVVFRDAAVEKARLEAQAAAAARSTPTSSACATRRSAAATRRRRRAPRRSRRAAVAALADGLAKLAEGDLTVRLDRRLHRRAIGRSGTTSTRTIERLQETIAGDRRIDPRGRQCGGRNLDQHHRPVAAHRGAGREPGADLGLDGGDLRDRQEERRERPAGQRVRRRHPRGRRSRRRGGRARRSRRCRGSRNPRARSPTSSG